MIQVEMPRRQPGGMPSMEFILEAIIRASPIKQSSPIDPALAGPCCRFPCGNRAIHRGISSLPHLLRTSVWDGRCGALALATTFWTDAGYGLPVPTTPTPSGYLKGVWLGFLHHRILLELVCEFDSSCKLHWGSGPGDLFSSVMKQGPSYPCMNYGPIP